jgi:hypothetical protein
MHTRRLNWWNTHGHTQTHTKQGRASLISTIQVQNKAEEGQECPTVWCTWGGGDSVQPWLKPYSNT